MPVRYMGTKRYLAPYVRDAIDSVQPRGPVIDLFSGIGAVASALASRHHVITNDVLSFTLPLARARFAAGRRSSLKVLLSTLRPRFRERERELRAEHGRRIAAETQALESDWPHLATLMSTSPHAGNSGEIRNYAVKCGSSLTNSKYSLTTLYFSCGYFSTLQAVQLDALRYAIDAHVGERGDRDWLMAAWLSAAATVINAPGHTAQFLRVSSEETQRRVRRTWSRRIWEVFIDRLADIQPEGTYRWRSGNRFLQAEAISLLSDKRINRVGCIYADPPYTKDHYSRYYHVYETMFRYDYPDSVGEGRYRSDRFVTEFSIKTRVEAAFQSLIAGCLEIGAPLILSYPDSGLLEQAGVNLGDLLDSQFQSVREVSFNYQHSTLGASDGQQKKKTVENVYVCISGT